MRSFACHGRIAAIAAKERSFLFHAVRVSFNILLLNTNVSFTSGFTIKSTYLCLYLKSISFDKTWFTSIHISFTFFIISFI